MDTSAKNIIYNNLIHVSKEQEVFYLPIETELQEKLSQVELSWNIALDITQRIKDNEHKRSWFSLLHTENDKLKNIQSMIKKNKYEEIPKFSYESNKTLLSAERQEYYTLLYSSECLHLIKKEAIHATRTASLHLSYMIDDIIETYREIYYELYKTSSILDFEIKLNNEIENKNWEKANLLIEEFKLYDYDELREELDNTVFNVYIYKIELSIFMWNKAVQLAKYMFKVDSSWLKAIESAKQMEIAEINRLHKVRMHLNDIVNKYKLYFSYPKEKKKKEWDKLSTVTYYDDLEPMLYAVRQ